MLNLILIRGLPSSGKSTLAEVLDIIPVEADLFFHDNFDSRLPYNFDPAKLSAAHQWCQNRVKQRLHDDESVLVANTFTTRWEMQPYIEMAMANSEIRLTVVDLYDGGCTDEELHARNKHGVPLETFATMRARYEHDWKNGNPVPSWLR